MVFLVYKLIVKYFNRRGVVKVHIFLKMGYI